VSSNKSFSSETTNRYALALYELAKENSELEVVEKNVNEVLAIYNTNEDLKNFIKNPTQSQSSQLEVLKKVSIGMNLSKITHNFLSILVSKRRIFYLNTIFLNFLSLASKKRGELKASLISSKNLSNEELKNLNTELSQAIGTTVAFDYKVDETLIGGLKMQIGSLMVDTSIKNKLKKYEQIMLEA
jgi:F-type H+-transporting ATPase subunit delta|tara:strand:- start:116 stop:673 length:558 start_codon:yes stop_codon:yes gene_type:complete